MQVKGWNRTVEAQALVNELWESIRRVQRSEGNDTDLMAVRALADFGLEVVAAKYKLQVDDTDPRVDDRAFEELVEYVASPF